MPIITFSFIFILLLFLLIINSIRRGALETKYAILWIFVCVSMAILSSTEKNYKLDWTTITRRISSICFIFIWTIILFHLNF